jgi:hypothetical protein
VFLVGCRVKKIERLVGDVTVLAVLIVFIFIALVVAIALPKRFCTAVRAMPSPSITPACFWLVVACKISNGGHLRPLSDFISVIFFVVQFAASKKGKHPPLYTPARRRMLSVIPPITAANYWFIFVSRTKRRPSEAEDPPPSLFFNASSLGIPTKGTSRGKNEPTAKHL